MENLVYTFLRSFSIEDIYGKHWRELIPLNLEIVSFHLVKKGDLYLSSEWGVPLVAKEGFTSCWDKPVIILRPKKKTRQTD